MELRELIEQIDAVKAEIDALRPLSPDVEGRIMQKLRFDWDYHSSNIEGNSLTFGETKVLLLHGLTVGGKPLRDHIEMKGHHEAILALEDIVRGDQSLTEHTLKNIHELILGHDPFQIPAETSDGMATRRWVTPGRYKREPNHVLTTTGEMFEFATPLDTPVKMQELMTWYNNAIDGGELHPLVIGSEFHYRFVRIHPFDDGNGRLARILMNLVFMKHGYPPAIIRTEDRANYYRALQVADDGNSSAFIIYVGEQLLRSCEVYLRGAHGESIEEPEDLDRRIALFKVEMAREKDLSSARAWKPTTEKDLYDTVLYPIIKYVQTRLSGLNDLFSEMRTDVTVTGKEMMLVDGGGYFSSGEDRARLYPLPTPDDPSERAPWLPPAGRGIIHPGIITVALQWRGYRQAGANTFSVSACMSFVMDEFVFALNAEPGNESLLRKRYDQAVSGEEMFNIAKWYAEFVMKEISSQVAKASD